MMPLTTLLFAQSLSHSVIPHTRTLFSAKKKHVRL